MVFEERVRVDGREYTVVFSDERKTLLAAKAAGKAVVGLLTPGTAGEWLPAKYVVAYPMPDKKEISQTQRLPGVSQKTPVRGCMDYAGERYGRGYRGYAECIVRREIGLPWRIAKTERLVIREFTMEDLPHIIRDPGDTRDDAVFYTPQLLEAYIRDQYGFYECGMWALVRKEDDVLVGAAGVTLEDQEETIGSSLRGGASLRPVYALGYHIFSPYRRQGYAREACRRILHFVEEVYGGQTIASVMPDNEASIRLLETLGFCLTGKCSGSGRLRYWYAGNC